MRRVPESGPRQRRNRASLRVWGNYLFRNIYYYKQSNDYKCTINASANKMVLKLPKSLVSLYICCSFLLLIFFQVPHPVYLFNFFSEHASIFVTLFIFIYSSTSKFVSLLSPYAIGKFYYEFLCSCLFISFVFRAHFSFYHIDRYYCAMLAYFYLF